MISTEEKELNPFSQARYIRKRNNPEYIKQGSLPYNYQLFAELSLERKLFMKKSFESTIGRVAALSIAVETTVFALTLIWGILFHTQFDQILGYIASLLLAISVVVLMACFYVGLEGLFKIFGLLALAAALIYAPFCISTYFLQLSIVAIHPLGLSAEVLDALTFEPGSPMFALDMLGYGFLCLSTLAAAFALVNVKDRALRTLCFIHGGLALPTFLAPIISGIFQSSSNQVNDTGSYVLLFWCAVFIPIALLFRRYFEAAQER